MYSVTNRYSYDYRDPEYVKDLKVFIENVRKSLENDPNAKQKAKEVLIETGVADKNGHIKEKIVSWG